MTSIQIDKKPRKEIKNIIKLNNFIIELRKIFEDIDNKV